MNIQFIPCYSVVNEEYLKLYWNIVAQSSMQKSVAEFSAIFEIIIGTIKARGSVSCSPRSWRATPVSY